MVTQFYAEVKRKDGTDYQPISLSNMQAAIDRRQEFRDSNALLEGKTERK